MITYKLYFHRLNFFFNRLKCKKKKKKKKRKKFRYSLFFNYPSNI